MDYKKLTSIFSLADIPPGYIDIYARNVFSKAKTSNSAVVVTLPVFSYLAYEQKDILLFSWVLIMALSAIYRYVIIYKYNKNITLSNYFLQYYLYGVAAVGVGWGLLAVHAPSATDNFVFPGVVYIVYCLVVSASVPALFIYTKMYYLYTVPTLISVFYYAIYNMTTLDIVGMFAVYATFIYFSVKTISLLHSSTISIMDMERKNEALILNLKNENKMREAAQQELINYKVKLENELLSKNQRIMELSTLVNKLNVER